MKLADTVALVTGAGRGIGRAIALAFAHEGADLVVASLEAAEVESIQRELHAMGRRVVARTADVSQEAEVQALVDLALAEFGRIDVLVNNAGTIILPGDVLGTTVEAWDRMLDVNARSVFLCCKAVLPGMMQRRRGKIINISSAAGLRGLPERATYCAAKHAVTGFTKALAIDMKPYGIAVNAICPGAVATALTDYARPDADKSNWMVPQDIADVALFLASSGARAMTGAMVEVNGWAG
jgi:NAD(P)-dependent dehydrogenase (short-subunit alcohol dehydrogenase family)